MMISCMAIALSFFVMSNVFYAKDHNSKKWIALTFDDGPKRGTTDILLEELRKRDVKATFFLIGEQIEENKDIVKQMYQDGHQIGNHTFHHMNLNTLDFDTQKKELILCNHMIGECANESSLCIRPPYGEVNEAIKLWINAPIILWSVDTLDWTGKTAEEIAAHIIENAKAGDIVLMHDIYDESIKGVILAIDQMKKQGYSFVTVRQMFYNYHKPLEKGKVYRKIIVEK